MNAKKQKELYNFCLKFVEDNEIGCSEVIYQSDRIVERSLEFIESVCNIVGYHQFTEDD
jgi:hypothetical protein